MRRKKESVLCFASNDEGLPKVIRNYRARYRVISRVLDKNGEILDRVDRDLQKLSQGGGAGRGFHLGEHPAGPDRAGHGRFAVSGGRDPYRQRPVSAGLRENAEKFITDYEV